MAQRAPKVQNGPLAREAAFGLATIKRAEGTESETSMTTANDLAVCRALEAAGIEFIDENGGGPGVRLRKAPKVKNHKCALGPVGIIRALGVGALLRVAFELQRRRRALSSLPMMV
jgi:hypothetical protein